MFCRQHANLAGTLSGHASWVLSVAFSPDHAHFVSRLDLTLSETSFLLVSVLYMYVYIYMPMIHCCEICSWFCVQLVR